MCCICRLPNCCSNIICPRINFTIVVGSTVKLVGATTYYCNTTYVGGGCDGEINWFSPHPQFLFLLLSLSFIGSSKLGEKSTFTSICKQISLDFSFS
jgi:hypothetical protein